VSAVGTGTAAAAVVALILRSYHLYGGLTQEQNEILLLCYNLVLHVTGQDPYDQGLYSWEVHYVHGAQKQIWQSTV
jgi:hypothetical protein